MNLIIPFINIFQVIAARLEVSIQMIERTDLTDEVKDDYLASFEGQLFCIDALLKQASKTKENIQELAQ